MTALGAAHLAIVFFDWIMLIIYYLVQYNVLLLCHLSGGGDRYQSER